MTDNNPPQLPQIPLLPFPDDGYDEYDEYDEDNAKKDGEIIGYGCFNSNDNYKKDDDWGYREPEIQREWKYMVQFKPNPTIRRQRSAIPDILGNGRNNRDKIYDENNKPFIELIPEDSIDAFLSENNGSYLIKKHYGNLIKNKFTNAKGYDVDWDVFRADLQRVPGIADVNICNDRHYFGFDFNDNDVAFAYEDEESEAFPCLNVLFLVMITGCHDKMMIEKLLELNSNSINYHSYPANVNMFGYHRWLDSSNFYQDYCECLAPTFLDAIDPVILRLLLQKTRNSALICFGSNNDRVVVQYGLHPIIKLLQGKETSTESESSTDLNLVSNDENNSILIPTNVKVILEESNYALSKLLGEYYKYGRNVLVSRGVNSALAKKVISFATLHLESKKTNKWFTSTFKINTLPGTNIDPENTNLMALMFNSLKNDNQKICLQYTKMYMKNIESTHDDYSFRSLVNCILDKVLLKKNKLQYWNSFWKLFKDNDWSDEIIATDVDQNHHEQQHPLLTAINHEYRYEIIVDIVSKDPTILELSGQGNPESLPPFALVAATRSQKYSVHPEKNCDCKLFRHVHSKKMLMEQALICCKCTNSFSSGKKDPIDIQDYNNDLDATYELLTMNPSVIGCVMMNGDIDANNSQKRSSKTTTEDGTIGEELLAEEQEDPTLDKNDTSVPSRPQKRAKNEAA
ncbi:hypothetical protein FRACYDRAFT_251140 [Fragilariopsis cylindrus CCMP1102]|uniref:Uncharacterized protein n=1 Tax=Fragilariopsis cylindrus CCMP1102 TaxID=635003 RepID=A0A1E7EN56_9STRA|nr:hypothetical protein FRACYDRAFT_251140 [Fragilariopsis cylindrus CCMP1102]|eukprot:OEU07335.1 hypothetical protein FRACYDRAFT_251140 [Fragilariopsis cylindrus CCMP1102]